MYYVTDYFTDEIITITDSFEHAKKICELYSNSQVETETDEILWTNIELPF